MASIIKANQLQDFGGNSIITSDGSGTITLSSGMNTAINAAAVNTPAFRATMSADQDSNSSESNVKVAFNTETFDEGSCYDPTTNYRFTVPSGEAGKYLIIAHTHTRASGSYSGKTCRLYKNGSFLTESQTATAGDNLHASRTNNEEVTTIENLSVGDYIEVYVKCFGSTFNIEAEGAYFSACKLNI